MLKGIARCYWRAYFNCLGKPSIEIIDQEVWSINSGYQEKENMLVSVGSDSVVEDEFYEHAFIDEILCPLIPTKSDKNWEAAYYTVIKFELEYCMQNTSHAKDWDIDYTYSIVHTEMITENPMIIEQMFERGKLLR